MVERIARACLGRVKWNPFGVARGTAVAAYQNGREFVSVEQDSGY